MTYVIATTIAAYLSDWAGLIIDLIKSLATTKPIGKYNENM